MLQKFADEHRITFPLLSDSDSAFISEVGIFNDSVATDSRSYGIPYPGTFVIDHDSRVTSKVFHKSNYVRDASATAMRETLGIDLAAGPSAEWCDDVTILRAKLDTGYFVRQRRIGWRVAVALADGFHIYGNQAKHGFRPLQVVVNAPEGVITDGPSYPDPILKSLSYTDSDVPLYERRVEIAGGLTFADIREDAEIELVIQFQACNEHECFTPASARLVLPIRYEAFR